MTGDLVRAVVQGYVAPRASVRWLLNAGHGLEAALGMLALGYLAEAILMIAFSDVRLGIGGHLFGVLRELVSFFVLSSLIYGVGRLAGGTGTLRGAQLVFGWHALVTSIASPLGMGMTAAVLEGQAEGEVALSAGPVFLAFIYAGVWLWLLASYVAELHGFRNSWGVLGAITGFIFTLVILLTAVFGPMTPA